ncbi:MAG: AAA family ATPase, partial [Minisyncoccia bacterium]
DEKSRYAVFNIHTRGKPLDRDVDLKKLAKLTEELTGSDIELICKKAAMAAIRENVNKKSVKQDKNFKISQKHFEEAMK